MLSSLLLSTLTLLAPLAHAHGKVVSVRGDLGGNGTALGIIGNIVPGTGPNAVTEIDTTFFKNAELRSDGLGKTKGTGENHIEGFWLANGLSGGKLPQVSAKGGSVVGVYHIVTTVGGFVLHGGMFR